MPNRARTDLHFRLKFSDTKKKAISQVIREYRKARSLDGAAEALGVGVRTLKRLAASEAELGAALEEERKSWGSAE